MSNQEKETATASPQYKDKQATPPGKQMSPAVSKTEGTAPATDVNSEGLRHENERLRETLSRLVFKIKAECAKGTPLSPEGHGYAIWNRHYPAEFTRARQVLQSLGISHELVESGETFKRLWNEYREVERSVGQ